MLERRTQPADETRRDDGDVDVGGRVTDDPVRHGVRVRLLQAAQLAYVGDVVPPARIGAALGLVPDERSPGGVNVVGLVGALMLPEAPEDSPDAVVVGDVGRGVDDDVCAATGGLDLVVFTRVPDEGLHPRVLGHQSAALGLALDQYRDVKVILRMSLEDLVQYGTAYVARPTNAVIMRWTVRASLLETISLRSSYQKIRGMMLQPKEPLSFGQLSLIFSGGRPPLPRYAFNFLGGVFVRPQKRPHVFVSCAGRNRHSCGPDVTEGGDQVVFTSQVVCPRCEQSQSPHNMQVRFDNDNDNDTGPD